MKNLLMKMWIRFLRKKVLRNLTSEDMYFPVVDPPKKIDMNAFHQRCKEINDEVEECLEDHKPMLINGADWSNVKRPDHIEKADPFRTSLMSQEEFRKLRNPYGR